MLEEKIHLFEEHIQKINDDLKRLLNSSDRPVALVDKLLELSIKEKKA